MADIALLRAGIEKNLATVPGLRIYGLLAPTPNPPYAMVNLDNIDYHRAFKDGLSTYNFSVTVVVGLQSERTAQASLDAYVSPTTERSIKSAIESDKTLNGSAFDVFVSGMRNYGSVTINEQTYLAAEFDLTVQAN